MKKSDYNKNKNIQLTGSPAREPTVAPRTKHS